MEVQLYGCGLALTLIFACAPCCLARGGGGDHGSHQDYHYREPFAYSSYPAYYNPAPYPYTPTPEQQEAAGKRVKTYYASIRQGRRRPAKHRYIAIETLRPTKEQSRDYLKKRLAAGSRSESPAGAGDPGQLRCVMVFDTVSQQFAGSKCYVLDGLPGDGTVMRFESLSAEYVGQ